MPELTELMELLVRELSIDFPLSADLPLLSSGLIDSLRVARLLVALELHYGIEIDSSEIGADNFDSPAQMYSFMQAKCPSLIKTGPSSKP